MKQFSNSSQEKIQRLDTAFVRNDYEQMREIAHSLKSDFSNLGYKDCADLLEQMDRAPEKFTAELYDKLLLRYNEEIREVQAALLGRKLADESRS